MSPADKAGEDAPGASVRAGRAPTGQPDTVRANGAWWDVQAEDYLAEHGSFLGEEDFVWGPEGVREDDLRLLGEVAGRDVLEIGCGGGQCSRWLAKQGARVVGTDLSAGMLGTARALNARNARSATAVPLVQCDGSRLPFADAGFDIVCTAYGVIPFVADTAAVMRECARVLRPGGRLTFSTTHPVRWAFPDEPGSEGLTVRSSYFERTPYVEYDAGGRLLYAEHHRTIGDRVREIVAAGLVLRDIVEPEWPPENEQIWGGWSPTRGALIPGTAIFVADKVG